MSPLGLGRVKTPTFNLRVEIPSRFRKFENQKCLRPLLREDDRENNSAHSWLLHVFTQPGSIASFRGCANDFRTTPINRHSQSPSACLKGTTSGLTHRSAVKPYSITSSANASTVGGISRLRTLAVLRLTTNSNFVDCITGRSAAFSPLRIFPA
jgi:hypothetical protein